MRHAACCEMMSPPLSCGASRPPSDFSIWVRNRSAAKVTKKPATPTKVSKKQAPPAKSISDVISTIADIAHTAILEKFSSQRALQEAVRQVTEPGVNDVDRYFEILVAKLDDSRKIN